MTTAHILHCITTVVSLLFPFLVNLNKISPFSRADGPIGDVVGWRHYLFHLCPEPLTFVTLTYVYINQMLVSTLDQKPCLSPHTSHDHSLIYSHLPQPLIDGSHLINALAVQGFLTCPIGTPSLTQAAALQLKSPGYQLYSRAREMDQTIAAILCSFDIVQESGRENVKRQVGNGAKERG